MLLQPSRTQTQWIRGLAISAVVLIHIFSMIHGLYTEFAWRSVFISLDQSFRFCVPVFLFLSGWGLTKKYGEQAISWSLFVWKRMSKLLPFYVLWSVVSYLLINLAPAWTSGQPYPNLLSQLAFGQADYQLYFLPLVFQLYILYPFLLRMLQRWPLGTVLGALITQSVVIGFFTVLRPIFSGPAWMYTDHAQYLFCLSWIGYFVVGMYLAQHPVSDKVVKWSGVLTLGALAICAGSAIVLISRGLDPLYALMFTRWPVMVYGLLASIFLCSRPNASTILGHEFRTLLGKRRSSPGSLCETPHQRWYLPCQASSSPSPSSFPAECTFASLNCENRLGQELQVVFGWLGKHSYLIFLAHVLVLRWIVTAYLGLMFWPIMLGIALVWLLAVGLTYRFFPE